MGNLLDRNSVGNFEDIKKAFIEIGKEVDKVNKKVKDLGKQGISNDQYIALQKEVKGLSAAVKKLTDTKQKGITVDKEYVRLQNQVNALISRQEANYKELNREKQRLMALQNKENAAIRQQVTGQHGLQRSFTGLIKSISSYFFAMVALQRIIQFFTRDLLEMTKKLDSLDYSMKTIIKSQRELAQTQSFLLKTSINYGHDILTLTDRYIKFRAASQQSNMTVRDTMRIFDSVAKAAGVLGLKTDEVNGVFLALEQMISKGKVTTEELRRQLGERLPGAMGIMADALGVTISELDKMLKAGTVLSSDALPKFAIALEKAYGIESVKKIDTLAAAQGRLKTSWVQFVDSINASKPYISVINAFASAINKLNDSLESNAKSILNKQGEILTEILKDYDKIIDKEEKRKYIIDAIGKLQKEQLKESKNILETQDKLNSTSSTFAEGISRILSANMLGAKEFDKINEALFGVSGSVITWNRELDLSKETSTAILNVINQLKKEFNSISKSSDKINIFDLDQYVNDLDEVKNKTEEYSKLVTSDLKKRELESSKRNPLSNQPYMTDQRDTYKEILSNEYSVMRASLQTAKVQMDSAENLYNKKKGLDKEEVDRRRQNAENAVQNYNNIYDALIEIEIRLNDNKTKDDSLARMKAEQEARMQILIQSQNDEMALFTGDKYGRKILEYRFKKDQLELEKTFIQEQLGIVKKGSLDYLQIIADQEKNIAEIKGNNAETNLYALDEFNKEQERIAKENSDAVVSAAYAIADKTKTIASQSTLTVIRDRKLRNKEIERLQRELALFEIRVEIDTAKKIINSLQIEEKERAAQLERLEKLYNEYAQKQIDNEKQYGKDIIDERRKNMQAIGDIVNNGFEYQASLFARQLERAKEMYETQTRYAGTSVEKRLLAEKKFEKEEKKIKQREDIANKLQTIFNIALQIALASAEMNAIQIIAAGSALGLAIATPLPSYEKGAKHQEGGAARVSEKGSELIKGDDGRLYLTPEKESVMNIPAGEIMPHDQTQKMLANYAMTQIQELDMSLTNKHLSNIEKNTKEHKTIEYINGVKIIRKGHRTTRIL